MLMIFHAPNTTRILHGVDLSGRMLIAEETPDGVVREPHWYWVRKRKRTGPCLPERYFFTRYTHIVMIEKDKIVWQWKKETPRAQVQPKNPPLYPIHH